MPTVGEVLSLNVRRGTQVRNSHLDRCLEAQHTTVESHDGLGNRQVHALCRLLVGGGFVGALSTELLRPLLQGEEVQAGHHVQTRHGQRLTGRRGQDVVGGQHQDTRLSLCFCRQRKVHGHLVTVEVGVERLTGQRVQLDSFTLNQHRLERLNTQAVQRRRTVQHHRVLRNGFFQHVPHLGALAFHHALGRLDVLCVLVFHQTLHHERLEQFQRHQLR